MPLYEYQCDACGQRFEVIQKFSDPPVDACRQCAGGPVRRLLSSPAIQFKGSGWYITDYSQKGKPASGESADGAKTDAAKADAGKSDAKESKSADTKAAPAAPASSSKSDT